MPRIKKTLFVPTDITKVLLIADLGIRYFKRFVRY